MIGRIADWITIITGPLAVLTTFGAWLGELDKIAQSSSRGSIKPELLAAALIILIWCFFFFAQLRCFAWLYRQLSETASFFLSYLVVLVGLAILTVIELLILDRLVPSTDGPLIMMAWLCLPSVLWIIGSVFSVSIVIGGLFEKVGK
jgi:hypothetical protein